MTIYVTGDLHGDHDFSKIYSFDDSELTKDDYLLICGDFGCIWDYKGEDSREHRLLEELNSKNYTTLFVDGNHECHPRLANDFPVQQWKGGKIHTIRDSVFHLMRGQVFTIGSKKIFTMGGAASHDTQFRREGISWWREEIPCKAEKIEAIENLKKHDFSVDYIITHDCPESICIENISKMWRIDGSRKPHEFNKWLESIADAIEFKHWYYGHWHTNRDSDNGKFTCLYDEILPIGSNCKTKFQEYINKWESTR